jgi:hypothetical protein
MGTESVFASSSENPQNEPDLDFLNLLHKWQTIRKCRTVDLKKTLVWDIELTLNSVS